MNASGDYQVRKGEAWVDYQPPQTVFEGGGLTWTTLGVVCLVGMMMWCAAAWTLWKTFQLVGG